MWPREYLECKRVNQADRNREYLLSAGEIDFSSGGAECIRVVIYPDTCVFFPALSRKRVSSKPKEEADTYFGSHWSWS